MDRYSAPVPANHKILGDQIILPFSNKVAPSRFMKGAMTERLSSWDQHNPDKRGIPSTELIKVYEEWGKGGFGIILSGNTMVNTEDLEAPGNPILNKRLQEPERLAAFKEMSSKAKAHGSIYVTQLSHAGRQVANVIQQNPVAASPVKLDSRMGFEFNEPKELSKEGIRNVISEFVDAAELAQKTGSDGVQLHAAHGYLFSNFLSPLTNLRTDEYGGSVENRSRLLVETLQEIRKRIPDPAFSLSVKLNCVEFSPIGRNLTPQDARDVASKLESVGVDFIELSGGSYETIAFRHVRESTKKRESYFLEMADEVRKGISKTKLYVVGGFRTSEKMVQAIKEGSTDGISLARPVCEEFKLPTLLIQGKVPSSRATLLDELDFLITLVAAGTQIRQVANGLEPFNTSKPDEVEKFKKKVEEFMVTGQAQSSKGVVSAGYPDLEGMPLN